MVEKILNSSEIVSKILAEIGENVQTFSENIGVSKQTVYDIKKGRIMKISPELSNKILSAYPQFSRIWLLTGEGEMLVNGNNVAGDNNSGIVGNGNTQNSIPSDDLKSLIKAISTLTETNRQQSDQIGQLIRMLSANN